MTQYQITEIERAEKNHNKEYPIKVKFYGSQFDSRFFDLTEEQLKKIKEVLK